MQRYTLVRSDRRSIGLELAADGSLTVRAPRWMSEAEIRRFVDSKTAWLHEKRALLAQASQQWGGPVLSVEELAQLKQAARTDLAARLAEFAPRVGVQPTKLTIRTQHTRWGSCSSKGAISLNALLMLAPAHVRDYVVVHELCHLKEMNHSPRFWAEVARVLPDYAQCRDWLAQSGHALLQRNPKS